MEPVTVVIYMAFDSCKTVITFGIGRGKKYSSPGRRCFLFFVFFALPPDAAGDDASSQPDCNYLGRVVTKMIWGPAIGDLSR